MEGADFIPLDGRSEVSVIGGSNKSDKMKRASSEDSAQLVSHGVLHGAGPASAKKKKMANANSDGKLKARITKYLEENREQVCMHGCMHYICMAKKKDSSG